MTVLLEEIGEVSREILNARKASKDVLYYKREELDNELAQATATLIRWIKDRDTNAKN